MRAAKFALWPLLLAPLAWMVLAVFGQFGLTLGANPVEKLLHEAGQWGLRLLLLSLAVTPLRRWTGWSWLVSFRRLLGLFAFFYLSLHFTVYVVLDRSLGLALVFEDVSERPYITIGLAALLMLVPLAATSTTGMMRRLGGRWKKLHRLVYPAAILGAWHFYWQVKLDTAEPAIYAVILAVLLTARLWFRYRRHMPRGSAPGASAGRA